MTYLPRPRARRIACLVATALLCACTYGCAPSYLEAGARILGAELGATPHFRWERSSSLRLAPGSAVYVAIAATPSTMPSHDHEPTFRDVTANDLPWRLARLLNEAWSGPMRTAVGRHPESTQQAVASASAAEMNFVAVASLRDDGGPRTLWHRRSYTLEVQLLEAHTGKQVERIAVEGRAALNEGEVPERALVAALNELARNMTGDSLARDDRLGHLL